MGHSQKKQKKKNRKVNVKNEKLPHISSSSSSHEEIFEYSKTREIRYPDEKFSQLILFGELIISNGYKK